MTEVLCFGCIGVAGHYLHSKVNRVSHEDTPWGTKLDGGLLTDDYYKADTSVTGKVHEHHLQGWTAVSCWDRSGDDRGGSNTTFLTHADLSGSQLIELAKEQWPEVFARSGFPKLMLP